MAAETEAFGNVDVHCHILPGLDDGPDSIEVSVEMARMAAADGTTHLVATPHSNYQWPYQPEKNAELMSDLRQRVGDSPRLMIGCDFHLSYENIQDALVNPRKYSLNGGRYQLVEFPDYFNIDAMETGLVQLIDSGLVPVITHPERNPVFQQNRELAPRYISIGCVIQITSGVFNGFFGNTTLKATEDLLERNLVHLVASDGHSPRRRQPKLSEAAAYLAKTRGEEVARALVSDNPRAMIMDEELPYRPERDGNSKSRKSGKGFWAFLRS